MEYEAQNTDSAAMINAATHQGARESDSVVSQPFLSSIMEVLDDSMWERLDQLLSLDYKILSKVIANWIRPALGLVIHPNLICALPGRTISESLVLRRDMIAYERCERERRDDSRQWRPAGQSSYMNDVAIFCSDLLSVHRLMSICNQFELTSGAVGRLPEGAVNMVRRGQDLRKILGGAHRQGLAHSQNLCHYRDTMYKTLDK
eukprot:g31506.t1